MIFWHTKYQLHWYTYYMEYQRYIFPTASKEQLKVWIVLPSDPVILLEVFTTEHLSEYNLPVLK